MGIVPSGDAFGGSMGEVVLYGTSLLTPADLEAMATYLLDRDVGGIELAESANARPFDEETE